MVKKNKCPYDGAKAFMEGFDIEDNPFPEWLWTYEEWRQDFMIASRDYKEEGRFRDNSFKG